MSARPPRMDLLIAAAEERGLVAKFGRGAVKAALRSALEEARISWRAGGGAPTAEAILAGGAGRLTAEFPRPLRRVVNATGVVLHTNLGRSPLCADHLREAAEVLSGYVDLEMDVAEGARGHRDLRIERALRDLLGTDRGVVVVNNNAAAVLLTLHTLSRGAQTLVSRGELVEIGGGFRVPEVMAVSGAVLREVGTTNRTSLQDYEGALGPESALLLKVHPSNYRVRGFTHEVQLEELVALGRRRGLPVAMDLGSGLLTPEGALDLGDEPSVRACLAQGPEVLMFSGDKLTGACQAGILLVAPELVGRFRTNPLLRALRVDKVTYHLLGRAVEAYRRGLWSELPALGALAESEAALLRRARALARRLEGLAPGRFHLAVSLEEGRSGGGTAPLHPIPSPAVTVRPLSGSTEVLDGFLRAGDPPVVGVVRDGALHLHLRTMVRGDALAAARRLADYGISEGGP